MIFLNKIKFVSTLLFYIIDDVRKVLYKHALSIKK